MVIATIFFALIITQIQKRELKIDKVTDKMSDKVVKKSYAR